MFKRFIDYLRLLFVKTDVVTCECGEHSECVRKIHSDIEGRLWVENEDHFKCGIIKKQILQQ